MKLRFGLVLLYIILFAVACSNIGPKYKDTNDKLVALREEQHQIAKEYVTGTVDALAELDKDKQTPETLLAEELSKNAQDILGTPEPGDRIDVNALLSQNEEIKKAARKVLDDKKISDAKTAGRIQQLEKELDSLRAQLVEKGIQKEREDNRSIVSRVWAWSVGSFGLLGGIAFIVFCPAIAIPLFGALLRFIVSMVPSLFSLVGVVGSSVVTNIASGIGALKDKISSGASDKTYTKTEVLDMLKNELSKSMDRSDKTLIDTIKTKMNLS